MKVRVLYSLVVCLAWVCPIQADSKPVQWQDCSVMLQDNTLTLSNSRLVWKLAWNKGTLASSSLQMKGKAETLTMRRPSPLFNLGMALGDTQSGTWSADVIKHGLGADHVRVEVTTHYEHIDVRYVFRLYPDCPAIGCDYYLRSRDDSALVFRATDTELVSFALPGRHWHYRAVEFLDRTDRINTLVHERAALAYLSGTVLTGNILWGQSALHETGIFLIKEAPCSFVQLHHPGYDFQFSQQQVRMVGAGIGIDDLIPGQWVRTYGCAVGLCEKKASSQLKALRNYQKRLRKHEPERDDMIMMNTWGDRNKDARVGEAFVKREVDACARLGVTHLQIDDGWQQGISKNSAGAGKLWDLWEAEHWQPHADRFPNGFQPVVDYARQKGVALGLWFHPSNSHDYAYWQRDADIILGLYRDYGIRYFKIDGIKLPTKQAEINLRAFFDRIVAGSKGQIIINLDATADNRTGYHYFSEYGNIFLENRYTDWGRYYPYWTLRNLWMLSRYVPPERLQMEFLNIWRNPNKYDINDPLAPKQIPFDYAFAITMMAQPLAWFEGSNLPEEAFGISGLIKTYREHQTRIHQGTILPIGSEPRGTAWTGFQSLINDNEGYVLVFREYHPQNQESLSLYELAGRFIQCQHICGHGQDFQTKVGTRGEVRFQLPKQHSFALYRYTVQP